MKLIMAIVHDKDAHNLADALVANKVQVTKLASTGGFLREGNTTFLIGIDNERVPEIIEIIRRNCKSRTQTVTPVYPVGNSIETGITYPTEIQVGGATVFVLNVEQFHKL
ncbi:hypothetical protein BBF96_14075 [Anoxybacter fermentans]|uniref:Transcriptional regulator n=1 Tax=Anoxybacter fermentans TaxID=1323375 RepID=A0A3Q9HSQ1_9FIRM|nr:cyclic-di-AMP receptor [Anoxybacter fermentans]AZR74415.1 hypothetical protein BBF96_14075 [Anoxybacter fermentans]